jgi:TPP-dependent 2-oxoacid decarboxylase
VVRSRIIEVSAAHHTDLSHTLPSTTGHLTITSHLVARLKEAGVDHAFGIVGDFALRLFSALGDEGLPVLVTTDEQGAGFAADAYARLRGFGVVAVTYGAGGLKVANAAANAWAEQVPLLILSGSPGMAERAGDPMLHHKVKDFDTQLRVFQDLTCAQAVLTNEHTAADEIDRVIRTMIQEQRPGYIEVPRDLIGHPIDAPDFDITPELPTIDHDTLADALEDVMNELRQAKTAAIHVGAMADRRGAKDAVFDLAVAAHLPVASSSLGRGVFPERHELGLGIYMGAVSPQSIVRRVEDVDLLMSIGVLQTDLTLGAFTAHVDPRRHILISDDEVMVHRRTYRDVPLWAFLPALADAVRDAGLSFPSNPMPAEPEFIPTTDALTVERAIHAIGDHIDERHGLLLDPGEALFASVDVRVPAWAHASAYYATMGYAVPAALGAGKADPAHRPIAIVGDGAFAMTGLEAASCAFHGVNAIIIVLDNEGYGTQRPILDGPYNDIPSMAAEKMVDVFGRGRGFLAKTEQELDDALTEAIATDDLIIIRVQLPKYARSAGLSRLGEALAQRV